MNIKMKINLMPIKAYNGYLNWREKMDLSSKKLILALLYAPGLKGEKEPIEGITKVQKLIFLLTNKEFTDEIFYSISNELHYKPDNFGPFSDKLSDQIENLVDMQLVKKVRGKYPDLADEFNYYYSGEKIPDKFELTKYGEVLAKNIFEHLKEEEKKKISTIKKEFNSISLDALLSYVYNKSDKKEKKWFIKLDRDS